MSASVQPRQIFVVLCVIAGSIAASPLTATAARSPMAMAAAPAPAPAVDPAEDHYLSYSGTATDRHSAKFLYAEHHILRYREGRLAERVVLYTCANESPFARKTVSYVDPFAPDFLLEVASSGMREGVRTVGTERSVFFRDDGREPEKTGPLPPVRGLVADTGFDEFVRANWQPLMSGKPQELHFLVPSRLEDIDFKAQHLRSETLDGISAEVFRLKLAGFWGWVLPGIDVSYAAGDHTLMRYDGLSDLRDASGDNLQARITFPPGERRATDATSMAEARQAQLAPCR
jgi:hypothetical protein